MKQLRRIVSWFTGHPTATDALVAAALSLLALVHLYINWGGTSSASPWLAVGLTLLVMAPFTYRRSFPMATLVVSTGALVAYRSINIPESDFAWYAFLLTFFSTGAYGNPRWRDWIRGACAVVVLGFLAYSVFFAGRISVLPVPTRTQLFQFSTIVFNGFLIGAAWWIGNVFRIRWVREKQLKERTVQLEQERDENARRAVLDERVRIARELHDVVAHHVSVMGIQAGAARRIMKQQPEKVNEVLSQIENSSRQAVAEMQRLLGFLRAQSQTDELAPQPSLKQLDNLVAHMREAGLSVEVRTEGEPQELPPGVDLSAYRIVQEALTNSLKHGGTCTATVGLRYSSNSIELEITDTGRAQTTPESEGKGRGIIGMRERVTLHGGEFTAHRIENGGFRVRAELPLTGRVK